MPQPRQGIGKVHEAVRPDRETNKEKAEDGTNSEASGQRHNNSGGKEKDHHLPEIKCFDMHRVLSSPAELLSCNVYRWRREHCHLARRELCQRRRNSAAVNASRLFLRVNKVLRGLLRKDLCRELLGNSGVATMNIVDEKKKT
jgi:hypothetical protein